MTRSTCDHLAGGGVAAAAASLSWFCCTSSRVLMASLKYLRADGDSGRMQQISNTQSLFIHISLPQLICL